MVAIERFFSGRVERFSFLPQHMRRKGVSETDVTTAFTASAGQRPGAQIMIYDNRL